MTEGDVVWIMIDGLWQRGQVRTADEQSVQVRVSFGTEWRSRRYLAAESALGFAIEAVAKARDAVVEAADLWEQGAGYRVGDLERAVHALRVAVGEEAVARARLEALK